MNLPAELPGLGPKTERPRLNSVADLTAYTLTPLEGFVLSRVDGTCSYEQICQLTGLAAEATLDILRRFKREELILGEKEVTRKTRVPQRERPAKGTKQADALPSVLERHDDKSPVDPAELRLGPDLSPEMKARIVRLHRKLRTLRPHDLLGVPATADKETFKRAYFAASKELHPDRYFGKDIGPYREKLADIFARLTEAFQSLAVDRGGRAEPRRK